VISLSGCPNNGRLKKLRNSLTAWVYRGDKRFINLTGVSARRTVVGRAV